MALVDKVKLYHPIQALEGVPKDYTPEVHGLMDEEYCSEAVCYALSDYITGGRRIFDIDSNLTSLFAKTSINNVILEDLNLPFDTFYLHFNDSGIYAPDYFPDEDRDGVPFDISQVSESSAPIVGAYIRRHTLLDRETILDINLVAEYGCDSFYSHNISLSHHSLKGFIRNHHKTTIIENYLDGIYSNPLGNDLYNFKRKQAQEAKLGKGNAFDFLDAKENWKPRTEHLAWEAAGKKMLKLIVNVLLYLCSPDNDEQEGFPNNSPKKLLLQSQSENAREAKRASSKLEALGYTKIKFLGRRHQFSFNEGVKHDGVRTHWRVGHWRNQAHGKQLCDRRLIWVKPTIVNKGDSEIKGSIYDVCN